MKTVFILFSSLLLMFSCQQKDVHDMNVHDHEGKTYYTCSMDPQIMQDKPGKCPICHMDLTPVAAGQLHSNGISLSEQQILLGNIQTTALDTGSILKSINVTGTVKTNEENIQWVNARMDGRVDQLLVKTNGVLIQKGQVLYKIYSESLAALQTEYIQNTRILQDDPNNKLIASIQQGIEQKLSLLGIMPSQIAALKTLSKAPIPYSILSPYTGYVTAVRISEGSSVMEGQSIFELSDYKSLWIDAQVYSKDLKTIQQGNEVQVFIEGVTTNITGTVVQMLPQVSPSSEIHLVRIALANPAGMIQPGMQASIQFQQKNEHISIIVPSNAVLRSSEGNTVWVKTKAGVFESRMVETGTTDGSGIAILQGLKEGDEIVVSGAYLLQSEYVFKKGMNPMAGHEM